MKKFLLTELDFKVFYKFLKFKKMFKTDNKRFFIIISRMFFFMRKLHSLLTK